MFFNNCIKTDFSWKKGKNNLKNFPEFARKLFKAQQNKWELFFSFPWMNEKQNNSINI
jgi:hypothetical protein